MYNLIFSIILLCGIPRLLTGQTIKYNKDFFAASNAADSNENDLFFVCREVNIDTEPASFSDMETVALVDYQDRVYNVRGRYLPAEDNVQIVLHKKLKVLLPQKIKAVKVGEMILLPCQYQSPETIVYGYFRVASAGKINLLQKFQHSDKQVKTIWFTQQEEQPATVIPGKKRDFYALFKNQATVDFIKEHNLNRDDATDLVKIFDFHNR